MAAGTAQGSCQPRTFRLFQGAMWDSGTQVGEHNLNGPSHYEQKYLKLGESEDEKSRSSKSQNSNLTLFSGTVCNSSTGSH